MSLLSSPISGADDTLAGISRPAMTRQERDLRRLTRASVLASFLLVGVGALVSQTMTSGVTTGKRSTTQSASALSLSASPITSSEEFLTAVAGRRERSSLPILMSDPSLQTSAQGWADALPGRGIGHDPAILDGITDNWQQVAELVSSGPSFDAASRALLTKTAGASPLDDPTVTAIGVGNQIDGDTTILVVRLLRMPPSGDVGVQLGF